MSEIEISSKKLKYPWFTWILSFLSICLYLLINIKSDFKEISIETYTFFGAPAAIDIYQGQFWGVITNSFIHSHFIQLVFNLIGLWLLGAFVERRIGQFHYVLFGLFSSIITSVWQLTLSTDAGIGLSGVIFALWGYILIRSFENHEFKLKGHKIIYSFMIITLISSYVINYLFDGIIATETMVSGFISGVLVAFTIRIFNKKVYFSILLSILLICFSTVFYSPWSSEWNLAKGIEYHNIKQYKLAERHYTKALSILPKNKLAKENLKVMKIDRLSDKAYHFHSLKKYNTARKIYKKIIELDPKNEWAKDNIAELP